MHVSTNTLMVSPISSKNRMCTKRVPVSRTYFA